MPEDFPLPAGTRLTTVRRPFPGQLVIDGFVNLGLDAAKDFFVDRLPAAGYQLGRGDAEPGEAEALFTGNGLRGGWRVREIPNCRALTVSLVFIRQ